MSADVEVRGAGWWSPPFAHRWFVLAVALLSVVAVPVAWTIALLSDDAQLEVGLFGWTVSAALFGALLTLRVPGNAVGPVLLTTGLTWTLVPISIGVAIFKYRLYEIDRLVNRTVVYAIVVVVLGLLFLRKRTQRFVDRRFYRSRYDAQLVADEFAVGLRDELDADVVASQWAEVVRTTLQPGSVSLWVGEGS